MTESLLHFDSLQEESKQPLVAFKRYEKPREVEHVVVAPDSKVLGKALKKDNKIVKEALEVRWINFVCRLVSLHSTLYAVSRLRHRIPKLIEARLKPESKVLRKALR